MPFCVFLSSFFALIFALYCALFNESTSHLRLADLVVFGAGSYKLLVGAHTDDPALIEHYYDIAMLDGAYSLGYSNDGGAVQGLSKGRSQIGIGLVVEGGGAVVKNQNVRL